MEQFGLTTIKPFFHPLLFCCCGIIPRWCVLISGIIMGTSSVWRWVDAFETTGMPSAAYFSSHSFAMSESRAEKTKSHSCFDFLRSSTEHTVFGFRWGGMSFAMCHLPATASPYFFPAELGDAMTWET